MSTAQGQLKRASASFKSLLYVLSFVSSRSATGSNIWAKQETEGFVCLFVCLFVCFLRVGSNKKAFGTFSDQGFLQKVQTCVKGLTFSFNQLLRCIKSQLRVPLKIKNVSFQCQTVCRSQLLKHFNKQRRPLLFTSQKSDSCSIKFTELTNTLTLHR